MDLHYSRIYSYSIQHSTHHWMGSAHFCQSEFSMKVPSDLKCVARCPRWFHYAPLLSTKIHCFKLKIYYESIKSTKYPLWIHYEFSTWVENGALNNHGLMVCMRSFPLGLIWVELLNVRIGRGFIIMLAIGVWNVLDTMHVAINIVQKPNQLHYNEVWRIGFLCDDYDQLPC